MMLLRRLLDWLACPDCGGPLALTALRSDGEDVEEGVLSCPCTAAYPVVDGVPRLLEGAFLACTAFRERWSRELAEAGVVRGKALAPPTREFEALIAPTMERFQKEWQEHPLEGSTWGFDQDNRLRHALRYLGWSENDARGKLVLDAGCGTAKLTCGMARWEGEVIGIDLHDAAVRGWRSRDRLAGGKADNVHIVQGDLMHPPFRRGIFDGVHSSGVLHHTPDTRRAFAALAPCVKPGGRLGVWLYEVEHEGRGGVPWFPFVRAPWASVSHGTLRKVTTRLSPSVLHGLLFAYSAAFHVLYSASAAMHRRRHGQSIRERTTSLFDSLAPRYAWHHSFPEVSTWFREEGFEAIVETTLPGDRDGFCATGTRKLAARGADPPV